MALDNHIESLKKRHARLDQMIREEQSHLGSDDLTIRRLKFQKVELKDEIQELLNGRQRAAA